MTVETETQAGAVTCPGSQSKPATRQGRGPTPCTNCPTCLLRSWHGIPPHFCPGHHPHTHTKPLPYSLSDALDGFHPRTFLARLSCHLLQDMTLIHSTLDLWKGAGSEETLSWAPHCFPARGQFLWHPRPRPLTRGTTMCRTVTVPPL